MLAGIFNSVEHIADTECYNDNPAQCPFSTTATRFVNGVQTPYRVGLASKWVGNAVLFTNPACLCP